MNDEETIADITAEMRNMSKCGGLCFVGADGMADLADRIEAAAKRERAIADSMREALADLVENIEIRAKAFDIFSIVDKKTWLEAKAALAAPPEPPSNAAALREALEAILAKLLECAPTAEQEWPELVERARAALERIPEENSGNVAAMRAALRAVRGDLTSALHPNTSRAIIDAALSAPARNCDRFQTELDAQLAFLNDVWLISVEKETMQKTDKFENWTEQMKTCYGRWLLAPAKKGGAE